LDNIMNELNFWMVSVLVANLLIALLAIFCFRALQGVFAGVNVKGELSEKDNPAFGLAVAGGVLALCIILSSAVGGEAYVSLVSEVINTSIYAIAGVIFLKVGMVLNDKVFFSSFSVPQALRDKNIGVGLIQGANLIAISIIVHSAINWVDVENWTGIGAVAAVFIAGQLILFLVTLLRIQIYKKRNNGASWQSAIQSGNTALSIRYAGQILGTSIAVSGVAGIINYLPGYIGMAALYWFAYSVGIMIILWGLYRISLPVLLAKIDIVKEVDVEKNNAIAYIEAAIFIGWALILSTLLT
jgi:uncharacterized membrane protein YjfL (UPF0719 family)